MKKYQKIITKGFTLVELIIVIALIVIISAVLVFTIDPTNLFSQSRNAKRSADLKAVSDSVLRYVASSPITGSNYSISDFSGYSELYANAVNDGTGVCTNGVNGQNLTNVSGAFEIDSTGAANTIDISLLLNQGDLTKIPKEPSTNNNYKACIDTANNNNLIIYSSEVEGSNPGVYYFALNSSPTVSNFSTFTPTDVSGVNSWFDIDSLNNIPDGTEVSSWTSSTNGTTFTQSTQSLQPKRFNQVIGSNQPHSALQFDGTQVLESSISSNQPSTVILVTKMADSSATFQFYLDSLDTQSRVGLYKSGPGLVGFANLNASPNISDGAHSFGQDELISIIYNGSSSEMYSNGTLIASGDVGSNNITGFKLGNSYNNGAGFNGYIGDVLIFDRVLTQTERENIEQFLRLKYDF